MNDNAAHAVLSQQLLRLSGRKIDCCLENGTLVLRGRVTSFHQKQLVQTVAARLPGVERVVNELDVVAASLPERTGDVAGP